MRHYVGVKCFRRGLKTNIRGNIVWDRPNFYESPCISATLDAVMQVSRTNAKEIDLFDIYS